ncbi:hypothetical protein [Sinorhizobium americanum]|uniref:hypothetical protein n=1 Tax=Sinorhizobium americanum TaxID=194963 RepID=UPI00104CF1D7|nr:hypothetical protein [Sinorhizobium americanum]
MRNLFSVLALVSVSVSYLIPASNARADDWGCQVILCLSNPGGPMQYAACRPPIQRLWRALGRGDGFPTCSSVGLNASRPRFEPYYCDDGFRLTTRTSDRGQAASCVSTRPQSLPTSECNDEADDAPSFRYPGGDERRCRRYVVRRPHVRSKPHYVDVTIDGIGSQRVWY